MVEESSVRALEPVRMSADGMLKSGVEGGSGCVVMASTSLSSSPALVVSWKESES